eukprot:1191606-Pleurochrysis_carterae.AAC.2
MTYVASHCTRRAALPFLPSMVSDRRRSPRDAALACRLGACLSSAATTSHRSSAVRPRSSARRAQKGLLVHSAPECS